MEGPFRGISSTAPIKPSAVHKSSSDEGETKENESHHNHNQNREVSRFQSPKKETTQHFMASTISAASKTSVLRNKILTERNQHPSNPIPFSLSNSNSNSNSPDTHFLKNPDLDSKITPLYSSASESDDGGDDERINLADDLSNNKPYDSLTNYLSPRPKFRRYNPNRRRQVILRQENQMESEKEDEIANSDSGEEDDDDEIEEEERRGWGLFKFLLVFLSLSFSTLHISSMNSPESSSSSPTQQTMRGIQNGYFRIQDYVLESASLKLFEGGRSEFLKQFGRTGFPEVMNQRGNLTGFETGEIVEPVEDMVEVAELQNGLNEEWCVRDLEEEEEEGGEEEVSDQSPLVMETEEKEEEGGEEEVSDESPPVTETEEEVVSDRSPPVMEGGEEEVSDQSSLVTEAEEREDSFVDDESEPDMTENGVVYQIDKIFDDLTEFVEGSSSIEGAETAIFKPETERTEDSESDNDSANSESVDQNLEFNLIHLGLIGITVLVSSVLIHRLRKNRTVLEDSQPNTQREKMAETEEREETVHPITEQEQEKQEIKKVESFVKSKSEADYSHGFSNFRETVELLGELVIGEINSPSFPLKKTEPSTMDSPPPPPQPTSHGIFSSEKKMKSGKKKKKEEIEMTTPVRRSSRIRSRSIMSP